MAAISGAGASVSSGAGYQARIGAYIFATSICGAESEITREGRVLSVGFETTESIDDINITLSDGSIVYVQAKARMDFSISKNGVLRSVLEQFERQHRRRANNADRYLLITSSRSSRKITYDMRSALEAFRLGPEEPFRRDQPRAIVQIVDVLLDIINDIRMTSGEPRDDNAARAVLRKSSILCMDINNGDPLEQGLLLLLQSRQFAVPSALWGRIISDCISHAESRHSVNVTEVTGAYERFRVSAGELSEKDSDDLLKIEFGELNLAVGREVVLCRFPASDDSPNGLVIMELYRFDEDCKERTVFEADICQLLNGMAVTLIRRAATYEGLLRLIKSDPTLVGSETVTVIPMNSTDDYETGLCAETYRERLKAAFLKNPRLLCCVRCGKPVSSNSAHLTEAGHGENLVVGLCHESCLEPDDRVLGAIRSKFFEEYPELINFDLNAWFRASHSGQIVFMNLERVRRRDVLLAWNGRRRRAPAGAFVVEMLLQGGGREFVWVRNGIDRFSKAEAEDFVARFNTTINGRRDSDPLCYTEQTKTFAPRSVLIEQFSGKERFLLIESARARPYDERFAARYTRPGNWYAPILYLRDLSTEHPFSLLGSVVMLTAPLSLRNYLDNWREAGVPIPSYETASLLSDREFDDFMLWLDDNGMTAIVDPMLTVDTSARFAAGIPIRSIDDIAAAT